MAAVGGVFVPKGIATSKLKTVYDSEGREVEAEYRVDEEQNVKLGETVDLLLAAGYFRARIKGLSPFDKVVGGMVWCISICNFDVDVSLLFQENATIGQKISLTEKIVSVLPRMKCPHRIEPHQIQGLDFIHIFPVVQWLVKKAVETREEMGDYIRAYSISQFDKSHSTPEDDLYQERKPSAVQTLERVKSVYRPQRRYRRPDSTQITEEDTRVQYTLLEYGRRYGVIKFLEGEQYDEAKKESRKAAAVAGLRSKGQPAPDGPGGDMTLEELQEAEEKKVQDLLGQMTSASGKQEKLSAAAVGSVVGMQSEEIQKIATEYAEKQSELERLQERGEGPGGEIQHHKRAVAALQKQLEGKKEQLQGHRGTHTELQEKYAAAQQRLEEVTTQNKEIEEELVTLAAIESGENREALETLRSLVAENERLKKQEQEYRAHCKEELARLQTDLKAYEEAEEEADLERMKLIDKQYTADKEKLQKIKLILAKKNREIASLQRRIDETPSRSELSQYQRRFVELYKQVSNTHKETKQFYTLYNTLDNTRTYLTREVSLLNSVYDNFQQGMSSAANRDQFLKQFQHMVEGMQTNRTKMERKKQAEKMKRDTLNDEYLTFVEKQRHYFKTVKDLREECKINEKLQARLKAAER